MNQSKKKRAGRIKRHKRVRAKITGTKDVPRLSVFRSSKHIYAQVIDDTAGKTLLAVSDAELKEADKTKRSLRAGESLGEMIKEKGIIKIVFDRGGFKYHGRVKALAEGLRSAGIKF
ncbi:MAG: large subunit ribosomal protein L18 [Parcubacteria group bacterium Gr01-1014_44]|nr:MAG: large subunit ribosomal protein L18 [Parcubacteria group bacterium Gr01-1014_44]